MSASVDRGLSVASANTINNMSMANNNATNRELMQLRQEVSASQEIIKMMQGDSVALKAAIAHHKASALKEVSARQEVEKQYEAKLRELNNTIDAKTLENSRLQLAVQEALNERERQATAIADVRKSVDQRLNKLMEEVHKKDEELHTLRFAVAERDRDRDRAQMMERMLSGREENIALLLKQINDLRKEKDEVTSELRHKSLLVEQLSTKVNEASTASGLLAATPTRGGNSSIVDSASNIPSMTAAEIQSAKDVLAILPLYRQWSGDLRSDLELVDDGLDVIMDTATDLRHLLMNQTLGLGGGSSSATETFEYLNHDRQRLHKMRQMEKERMKQQSNLMLSASMHSEDPLGVHIHAVRAISDHSRYEMERIKDTVTSLADLVEHLKSNAMRGTLTVQQEQQQRKTETLSQADDGMVTVGFTQPTSVAGGPLTPSVVRVSQQAASQHAAEVSRLQEMLASRDEKLLGAQKETFEWREKASSAESNVRVLERELSRAQGDIESTRADLRRAEEELRAVKTAAATQMSEHMVSMDAQRQQYHALTAQHAEALRSMEEKHRLALIAASEALHKEVSDLRGAVANLERQREESINTEARLRSVLEDSKQKRLEWKRSKEASDEALAEARTILSNQNRELRQAQEMVDSLSAELAHVKDVLDFEVQQQEQRALMGGGVSPGGGGMLAMMNPTSPPLMPGLSAQSPSVFQQWKAGHRDEVRNAQAFVQRQPRKVAVVRKKA